jgi:hypothetical protein
MKTLLVSVCLFIAIFSGLQAKTTKFPEKDPAFSVTFPDDWTVTLSREGNLNCKAGEGSGIDFLIQKLDAQTDDEVKVFLPQIVKTLDLGDAKTAKVSEIKETTTPKGVKLFAISSANTASGVEMIYLETAFVPRKGMYFGLLNMETAAEAKAHEQQITEIINSITPVSDDGAK